MPNTKDKKYNNNNGLYRGKIVKGRVKVIKPYGAFIEIHKGVVGLLHLEDISVSRIRSPEDLLEVGQVYNFKIKSYDNNTGKITLNYKDLLGTWEENVKGLEEKKVTQGIVRNKEKAGVFVELKPNLVGLAEYKTNVSYGDKVNVYVKKIIPETKKIKLVILKD